MYGNSVPRFASSTVKLNTPMSVLPGMKYSVSIALVMTQPPTRATYGVPKRGWMRAKAEKKSPSCAALNGMRPAIRIHPFSTPIDAPIAATLTATAGHSPSVSRTASSSGRADDAIMSLGSAPITATAESRKIIVASP